MLKKVLIVDDEEPFLLSLTDGLRAYEEDFNVLTALDGKEAIEALNSAKIDLVITDLRMPRMDGFELLAYLSRSYPNIPVIVMTAYGTAGLTALQCHGLQPSLCVLQTCHIVRPDPCNQR